MLTEVLLAKLLFCAPNMLEFPPNVLELLNPTDVAPN